MSMEYFISLIIGLMADLTVSGKPPGPTAENPMSLLNCSALSMSTLRLVIMALVMLAPPTSMLLVRIGMLFSEIEILAETAPMSIIIIGVGSLPAKALSRAKASVSRLTSSNSAARKILM